MNASLIYITYRDRITQHVGMLGFLCFQNTQKLHSNLNNVKRIDVHLYVNKLCFFHFMQFLFWSVFLCKPLAQNLTEVISLLICISVQMWMFTLWTSAESQRRASQACAAASVHNLSSFSMLDISGEVRVLRPVRAAASGPLGKQQLEVRSNLLEATTMDDQHNRVWQSYFFPLFTRG